MYDKIDVFLWPQTPVGTLWFHNRNGRESASFQYNPAWLDSADSFALEPAINLGTGNYHTQNMSLFGSIGDSAPDRWGRILIRRREERNAKAAGKTPRTLFEADFLLEVSDEARQGALRFRLPDSGPFLAAPAANSIPPLIALPKLLSASERFLESRESEEDLRLLLAPGSSLGGARPKASVYDSDNLCIAKFPRKDDEFSVTLWEALALTLAEKAGINVPQWRIEKILDKPVLIIKRFDRKEQNRLPFISAMSMIGAKDNEQHSYLEIANALLQYGAAPLMDLEELWRRLVFSICISNNDDHLRNHGFLMDYPKRNKHENGWRLSPAYDLNPVPRQTGPHFLSLNINETSGEASIETALSVTDEFKLKKEKAKTILEDIRRSVNGWKITARSLGINPDEMERMANAFES
ncbi:MAG: type II toxin-antitoxin system HipA family toxin [Treponema sp.]|nr:type II toxin-antitoxin system HipA family toxin [Treponema sp.]